MPLICKFLVSHPSLDEIHDHKSQSYRAFIWKWKNNHKKCELWAEKCLKSHKNGRIYAK